MRLHALGYHDVFHGDPDETGFATPEAARYKLPWGRFVEHLDRIAERTAGPPLVAAEPLEAHNGSPRWALTFDDGGASALDVAAELSRRGWRGHFFVTTGRIGSPGFLDEDGVRDVAALGHVVGSHSVTHANLASLASWDDLVEEWSASAARLAGILSAPVVTGSVPGGWYSRRVAQAAASAGLRAIFTSEPVRGARRVDGCLVLGRRAIRTGDAASTAAAAAAGAAWAWAGQRMAWEARKGVKRVAGRRYAAVRRAWLSRG